MRTDRQIQQIRQLRLQHHHQDGAKPVQVKQRFGNEMGNRLCFCTRPTRPIICDRNNARWVTVSFADNHIRLPLPIFDCQKHRTTGAGRCRMVTSPARRNRWPSRYRCLMA